MIDRPWLLGRSFVLGPVAIGSSICSPRRRGPLDNTSPERSQPPRADLGSTHLGFNDTAIRLIPANRYKTGSGDCHPWPSH